MLFTIKVEVEKYYRLWRMWIISAFIDEDESRAILYLEYYLTHKVRGDIYGKTGEKIIYPYSAIF